MRGVPGSLLEHVLQMHLATGTRGLPHLTEHASQHECGKSVPIRVHVAHEEDPRGT